MSETTYAAKCRILGAIHIEYKKDHGFSNFAEMNDLGIPLAYFISAGIVETTPEAMGYINETWLDFLITIGLEDIGFETMPDVLLALAPNEEA
jgi:hypothetical protein